MDKRKKKLIFSLIVAIAIIILISVGSTFAYFSATISSEESAVDVGAAVFEIDLVDDLSLIKSQVIPSKEKYVNLAIDRLDETGNNVLIDNITSFKVYMKENLIYFYIKTKLGDEITRCI